MSESMRTEAENKRIYISMLKKWLSVGPFKLKAQMHTKSSQVELVPAQELRTLARDLLVRSV